ncbi:MAG: transcriptional regulator, TetR family [Acidobacteria bacterium]|nr:transcriptional regulator, TetR family [Acidobacteriota bacterium]
MGLMAGTQAARPRMSAGDRRAQLIDAALDVFSRKGFGGATTKEIAAEAGVAEAVIFRHFPSKEALYTAVLDSRLASPEEQRRQADLEALMERDDDEGVFRALLRNVWARYAGDARFERLVLFAALEGHQLGLARVGEMGRRPHPRAIRDYIARRQKAGALVAGQPAALLVAVNGMAHFYGTLKRIFGMPLPGDSDEEILELFARIALGGISRSTPATSRKKAKR